MSDCFIVMPISTPDPTKYSNDNDHFLHVLEHLFVPAITAAGLNPIRPIAEGAEIIQAEIIKNIEQADLVLCDISSLNANVFFELGIRTALNKPACLVRDDVTVRIPFDTTIINHYTYQSALTPWTLQAEVEKLAEHLRKTVDKSTGENSMWKYFGLRTRAELPHGTTSTDERIDLLSIEIEGLKNRIPPKQLRQKKPKFLKDPGGEIFNQLADIANGHGLHISSASWDEREMSLNFDELSYSVSKETIHLMHSIANGGGLSLNLHFNDSSL